MPKPKLPTATAEQFEGNTLMRIVSRNIKRVRYIDISLTQSLTIIGGPEEAGKSSLIDSVTFCLAGKPSLTPSPFVTASRKAGACASSAMARRLNCRLRAR